MATALIVRPTPRPLIVAEVSSGEITVGQLCQQFLESKRAKLRAGQLFVRSLERYEAACDNVAIAFGEDTEVASLKAWHFSKFRSMLPSTWGIHKLAVEIQCVRTIFKFAYDSELIPVPLRFGPDFKKPDLKFFRRERRLKGKMMFEADEIRQLLGIAPLALQAMILLGVNCGYGPADCGRLPRSAVDLKRGWIDFPRPKTEVPRVSPLWPETIEAIERYLHHRAKPKTEKAAALVFVTKYGNHWCDGECSSPITKKMKKLLIALGIRRHGCNFYALRRSFRTIASEAKDEPAASLIMGHAAPPSDMGALYVQRISPERLQAVVNHVRQWLFPGNPWDEFDPHGHKRAKLIAAQFDATPRLTGSIVGTALERLHITQAELARGTGMNAQYLNCVICERRPLSSDTELRIRLYVQQLAEGKTPTPLGRQEIPPKVSRDMSAVPLSDEAVELLSRDPVTREALIAVAESLASMGITQVALTGQLGVRYKTWQSWRQGYYPIPARAVELLRKLFGVEGGAR